MDLDLSPDEADVVAAYEQVFGKESTRDRVRAVEATGFDPALWKTLSTMGAVGAALPESVGGTADGLVQLVLLGEAAGRYLACVPVVEAAVAARLVAEVGGWPRELDRMLEAEEPVVFAPRPAERGIARMVPAGAVAGGVVALDDDDLVLVRGPAGPAGPDLGFMAAADRPLTPAGNERLVLASGADAARWWDIGLGWWRIGAAAVCAALASEAVTVAAEYAKTRVQFGQPIGAFQAIQHKLATVVVAADGARLLARETAWRHDHGVSGWRTAADMAYAHAGATAVTAAEDCLHVHGGYGYTMEYDPQLFLRRAKAMVLHGGDPDLIWESIGAAAVAEGGGGRGGL